MNLNIKKGDFFITHNGTIFKCVQYNDDAINYTTLGEVVKSSIDHWPVGYKETFTYHGLYDHFDYASNYNIKKIISKEENPEYFL